MGRKPAGTGPSLESMQAYAAKCQREREMSAAESAESTDVPVEEPQAANPPEAPKKRVPVKTPAGGSSKRSTPNPDNDDTQLDEDHDAPKDTKRTKKTKEGKEKVKPTDDKDKEEVKPKDDKDDEKVKADNTEKEKVKPKDDKENVKSKEDNEKVKPGRKGKEKVKPKDDKETVKPKEDKEKVNPKGSKQDKANKDSKKRDAKTDEDSDGFGPPSKKAKDIAAVLINAGDLPCEVSWKNLNVISKHFGLSEAETTSCLLAVLGPDPEKVSTVEIEDEVKPESSFDPTRHSSIRSNYSDEDADEDMEDEEDESCEDDDDVDGQPLSMAELKAQVIPPVGTHGGAAVVGQASPKEWA